MPGTQEETVSPPSALSSLGTHTFRPAFAQRFSPGMEPEGRDAPLTSKAESWPFRLINQQSVPVSAGQALGVRDGGAVPVLPVPDGAFLEFQA